MHPQWGKMFVNIPLIVADADNNSQLTAIALRQYFNAPIVK